MKQTTLFLTLLLTLVGCGSTQTTSLVRPTLKQSTTPYLAPKLSSKERASWLAQLNAIRAKGRICQGAGYFPPAPPLRWSHSLYLSAKEHSDDMQKSHTFSHTGSATKADWTAQRKGLKRGSQFYERILQNGYGGYAYVAENIEMGSTNAQEALTHWLHSSGHCQNIMNPHFSEVGMAQTQRYWTQVFATPLR